jgi:hypothetical protein
MKLPALHPPSGCLRHSPKMGLLWPSPKQRNIQQLHCRCLSHPLKLPLMWQYLPQRKPQQLHSSCHLHPFACFPLQFPALPSAPTFPTSTRQRPCAVSAVTPPTKLPPILPPPASHVGLSLALPLPGHAAATVTPPLRKQRCSQHTGDLTVQAAPPAAPGALLALRVATHAWSRRPRLSSSPPLPHLMNGHAPRAITFCETTFPSATCPTYNATASNPFPPSAK